MKRIYCFALLVSCAITTLAQVILVENTSKHPRRNAIARVTLKKPLPPGRYQVVDRMNGKILPAQLADSVTVLFMPPSPIPPKAFGSYALKPATQKFASKINIQHQQNGLLVLVGNKPLLFYHTAEAMPPSDSPAYYRRSGFIHPLFSPNGSVLTDDFPAGHAHQHGIFMTWVNTSFRGQFTDFWNQHKKTGTVEHAALLETKEGPVFTQIKSKLRHLSLVHGPVLEETWTLTIYPFSEYFLFDLESSQVNITQDTLYLNKYSYGGLAFRGSKEWNSHDKAYYKNSWQILTSEGKDTSNANHTHARWMDASGKIGDEISGATVFGHPANFRHPQSIRVHPEMPYWCFAPVVEGPFVLPPGKPYISRFRYFVHAGATDKNTLEMLYTDFIKPIKTIVSY